MSNQLEQVDNKQRILMKDNILVKTKYELNLAENRLYNLLLYKFQKEGNDFRCILTHKEIKEVIKNKEFNTIKGIDKVLDRLSAKKVFIEEKKANGKNSLWHNYKLIDGFTFDDEFNTFEIKATARIYDLLKRKFTNGRYTPSNLNIFLALNNYYAQRLYDLLRLWSNSKVLINYSVEELKDYFMLTDQYPEYGNFKRRVITPAIKELNKSGAFNIEIVENKTGRKVTSIDFIVEDLDRKSFNTKKELDNIIDLEEVSYETKDESDIEESASLVSTSSEESSAEVKKDDSFYVPNKKLFTAKTLENFKDDFKDYDFKDSKNKKALQSAVMATLEKEDEEKIKVKAYNYFKATLNDKLKKSISQESSSSSVSKVSKPKTRFHNINHSYDKFSDEELEKYLLEQQAKKGMFKSAGQEQFSDLCEEQNEENELDLQFQFTETVV